MRRRDFIIGLSAAALPAAVEAQQRQPVPVMGYLGAGTSDSAVSRPVITAVHRGLSETGYVEGRNLAVEYRFADFDLKRLPALADDLVRRQVSVILAVTDPAALAASAATKSIPIVFVIGVDPVELGLAPRLNRPGGNLTGFVGLTLEASVKALEFLHELVPAERLLAYLEGPLPDAHLAEMRTKQWQVAADALGINLLALNAADQSQFEAAFATLEHQRAGGLMVSPHGLFLQHADQLVALAARYRVPTVYYGREAVVAGGLMGSGPDLVEVNHRCGVYVGRILNGEKPADLPVQQVTEMRLTINMKAAKALGLTFPLSVLGRADEVIE